MARQVNSEENKHRGIYSIEQILGGSNSRRNDEGKLCLKIIMLLINRCFSILKSFRILIDNLDITHT